MQRKFENIDTKNEPEMVQVEAPGESAEKVSKRRWVIMMTNVNVSMYALCFWIQMGVLPVSYNSFQNSSVVLENVIHRVFNKEDFHSSIYF